MLELLSNTTNTFSLEITSVLLLWGLHHAGLLSTVIRGFCVTGPSPTETCGLSSSPLRDLSAVPEGHYYRRRSYYKSVLDDDNSWSQAVSAPAPQICRQSTHYSVGVLPPLLYEYHSEASGRFAAERCVRRVLKSRCWALSSASAAVCFAPASDEICLSAFSRRAFSAASASSRPREL